MPRRLAAVALVLGTLLAGVPPCTAWTGPGGERMACCPPDDCPTSMDQANPCCAGSDEQHQQQSRTPATVVTFTPALVALAIVEPPAPPAWAARATHVPARARSAPLHLLYSVLVV